MKAIKEYLEREEEKEGLTTVDSKKSSMKFKQSRKKQKPVEWRESGQGRVIKF